MTSGSSSYDFTLGCTYELGAEQPEAPCCILLRSCDRELLRTSGCFLCIARRIERDRAGLTCLGRCGWRGAVRVAQVPALWKPGYHFAERNGHTCRRRSLSILRKTLLRGAMQPNCAIDSDTMQSPMALARARHCGRYVC